MISVPVRAAVLVLAAIPSVSAAASITCPANITMTSSPGLCGASGSCPPPAVDGVFLGCDPASAFALPVGLNTVGCSVLIPHRRRSRSAASSP